MKHLLSIILLFCFSSQLMAQSDSSDKIQMSLLTCGVGDQLYSTFGHTAIRVNDLSTGIDEIYNYGLFDFYDPDFLLKFTRGKLLYNLGIGGYHKFVEDYRDEGRSVIEQKLNLNAQQKESIIAFLKENLKPENKSYKYDFLYDNCATRVRDIFPNILGEGFEYGNNLPLDKHITFRQILNQYLRSNHWPRLGINIILGSNIDKVMSKNEAMFLPDMLMQSMETAKLNGKAFTSAPEVIVKGDDLSAIGPNWPMWVMIALLVFTMFVFFAPKLAAFKPILSFLLLFISGLLGLVLLFMWFGTDHQSCNKNYSLLWAFPLNFFFAFTIFKPRKWHKFYSIFAITLLILAMLVHMIGIQGMPLTELLPFLLCLIYVYLFVYKRAIAAHGGGANSSMENRNMTIPLHKE